jgi:hypothetical protein
MEDKVLHVSGAASALFKSAPPLIVSGLGFMGVPLQEWLYAVSLVWILWQLGWSIWDRFGKPKPQPQTRKRGTR